MLLKTYLMKQKNSNECDWMARKSGSMFCLVFYVVLNVGRHLLAKLRMVTLTFIVITVTLERIAIQAVSTTEFRQQTLKKLCYSIYGLRLKMLDT